MKGQPHPNGMVAVEVVVAAQEFQTLRMTVAQPCGVVDVAVHTADELPIFVGIGNFVEGEGCSETLMAGVKC